jgi:hypothetical protein
MTMWMAMARRNQPQAKPEIHAHSASIKVWIENCFPNKRAFEMRLDGRTWYTQTVPPQDEAGTSVRELGSRVVQAISHENQKTGWLSSDAIVSRACDAEGTGCFMDYLVAVGEIEFSDVK